MRPLNVLVYNQLESTQTLAAQFARENERRVDAVQTLWQTKGRGRWGREWLTRPEENLSITFLLWEVAIPALPWSLGLAMAECVCRVVETVLPPSQPPLIRWPNDVMLNGKKLAGILVEIEKSGGGAPIALVGLGLNVNGTEFPSEIRESAISLRQAGCPLLDLRELGRQIGESYFQHLPDLIASPQALSVLLRQRDATTDKRFRASDGRQGTALRIADDGQIEVQWEDGTRSKTPAAEPV